MNPKEKAKELFNKFYNSMESKIYAKNCVNIVIDEIEAALTEYGKESNNLQNMDSEWRFLDAVREELNKL